MKRKIGLIVGYNGAGYHGLQWNKDTHTIEKAVMDALLENELVSELNAIDPQKIDLKSSSRTDKGVHAAFNLISMKICKEPSPEIEKALRVSLSGRGVHVYKMIRLPKKFVGFKMARSRVYKYYVPTFFLRRSNFQEEYTQRELEDRRAGEDADSGSECSKSKSVFREYKEADIQEAIEYKSGDCELFGAMMKKYIGTHDFKNFTLKSNTKATKRFIKAVEVSDPCVEDGVEYVEVTIHGQSFLLHQIRKMIAFAVLNCRYAGDQADKNFDKVFSEDIHVPKAPSAYLFLDSILFDDYNQKAEEKIEIEEEERMNFRKEKILPAVFKRENLYEWLQFLDAVWFHHENFSIFKRQVLKE